jgi:hypothetical protein
MHYEWVSDPITGFLHRDKGSKKLSQTNCTGLLFRSRQELTRKINDCLTMKILRLTKVKHRSSTMANETKVIAKQIKLHYISEVY